MQPLSSSQAASAAAEPSPQRPAAAAAGGPAGPDGRTAPEHYDVAIVGGGPAGLLAAKALLAALPEAKVKVFEAAPGYRPQGAGVLIEVNGWRALHAVDRDLAERMRARGILISGSIFYDEAGNASRPSPPTNHEANTQANGHTAVMVHWGDIREALFGALPEGMVSFSTRVVDITPGQLGGEPAQLQLQEADDGAAATRTVTAGLVIAADGYYSRTKRMAFGATGAPLLPTWRGKVVWRALVEYPDPEQVPSLLREAGTYSVWWLAPGQPPERTALVYPVNDNRYVWTCIAPAADIEAAGLPPWSPHGRSGDVDLGIQQIGSVGSDPKARCLAVFGRHPAALRDLLERTEPGGITEHGYYTHDVAAMAGAPDWLRGNVLAVGDAAHTGPPDGMGLNMAWEDVAVLAAHLKAEGGATQQALDSYCAARLLRVRDIWAEVGFPKPRRAAAVRGAAFSPLGPGSSGPDRTSPPAQQQQAQ